MINFKCWSTHILRRGGVCVLSKRMLKISKGVSAQSTPTEYDSEGPNSLAGLADVQLVKDDLLAAFRSAVSSVLPSQMIRNTLKVFGQTLQVGNETYDLKKNCYVVGFGKAVLGMAVEVEKVLHEHLVSGVISIPVGMREPFKNSASMQPRIPSALDIIEGAKDNLPDERAFEAAKKIARLAESLDETAMLVVLISGGGSALLPYPRPPITLEEKVKLLNLLISKGVNIQEMNCIRKRISLLKGGGLAKLAYPARVITLILSDVVGDPLDLIASGPTIFNPDPPHKALDIIRQYNLESSLPPSILEVINSPYPKDLKLPLDLADFDHTQNVVIGNNSIAVESAKVEATRRGYETFVLSNTIQSSVLVTNQMYVNICTLICRYLSGLVSDTDFNEIIKDYDTVLGPEVGSSLLPCVEQSKAKKGLCLIGAGETTVEVKGKGVGGRNQELALSFTMQMFLAASLHPFLCDFSVVLLSAGTDGIDGPTDAAGAFGYQELYELARNEGLSPRKFLDNNNSYNFYSTCNNGRDLLKIGHTGTNVMDLHMIIIQKR